MEVGTGGSTELGSGGSGISTAGSSGSSESGGSTEMGTGGSGPVLSSNADLSSFTIAGVTLSPTFNPATTAYTASVDFLTDAVDMIPTSADSSSIIRVFGTVVVSGEINHSNLRVGLNIIDIAVYAENGTVKHYTINLTRQSDVVFAQEAYIKASSSAGDQRNFGYSVSLSGDTLAVGAPHESSNATGVGGDQLNNSAASSGAVYIFTRTGSTWTQQAYIKASNTNAGDLFGSAITLSDNTLVVGAPQESSNATGVGGDQLNNSAASSGAVYIFTRTGSTWTQQAYIKASNSDAGDNFGISLSLSADTLAVGAYGESSNATGVGGDQLNNSAAGSGAVYVFTRTGSTWTQQAYVKASDSDAGDGFGWAVAISGDTLAVGMPGEDSNAVGLDGDVFNDTASSTGAVYIFVRSGVSWTRQAYLKQDYDLAYTQFGWSVSLSGNTLAAGAIGNGASYNSQNSGAVYVFARVDALWSKQAFIPVSPAILSPRSGDQFGYSVSISGENLIIGSNHEDINLSGIDQIGGDFSLVDSGAAYIFTRTGSSWNYSHYLKASNAGSGDEFGISVGVSGDTFVVGAQYEGSNAVGIGGDQSNNSKSGSGAVYVFH